MTKLNTASWEIPKHKTLEFFKKKTKYCIEIPVVNEGKKIKKQLEKMKSYSKLADIIILDGGSTDGSTNPKFLKKVNVRAILTNTDTSPGKQGRDLRMGLAYALKQGYEGIITIDGNGKDGINAIPNFIESLDQDFDYIQGSRYIKAGRHRNTPLERHLGTRLLLAPILSLGAGHWYTDTTNGFRGYSRKYLLHPKVKPFRKIFLTYDLLFYLTVRAKRIDLKTKEIPVTRIYPRGKVPTKITGVKVLKFVLTAFEAALGKYNPS